MCTNTQSPPCIRYVCLLADVHSAMETRIKLDWKTGVAATDWSSIAKKEHLDTLTMELRRLEDIIREVYSEMLMLQQREQEMRDISGAGEEGSMCCCCCPRGGTGGSSCCSEGTCCCPGQGAPSLPAIRLPMGIVLKPPLTPMLPVKHAESTNARLAWYSIASLFVCVFSGVWQLWYLRRFFQRKKLL